ncbi:MAG: hypothetical protein POELPBGB_02799 [Bacteroidia bacterium]|nr:hypothetical protein [Bacteroidia bacterium]
MNKPLLLLVALCTMLSVHDTHLQAQTPESELMVMGVDEMWYASLDCIKKGRITRIRETFYKADTVTRKVDMNKPYKISIYALGYLGNTAYGTQQMAAYASDTNNIIENYQWTYDVAGRLNVYQGVSNEGFEFGNSVQVQRDANGLITYKVSATTFSLKTPAKPVNYTYQCSAIGKNLASAKEMIKTNGMEQQKRYFFRYDANNNLINATLDSDTEKEREYTYKYNANNQLTEEKQVWYSEYQQYVPGSEGSGSIFGVYLAEKAATTKTAVSVTTYINSYEYDSQNRLVKMIYSFSSDASKSSSYEEYSYSPAGMLETISMYDEKGLTGIRKLVCN